MKLCGQVRSVVCWWHTSTVSTTAVSLSVSREQFSPCHRGVGTNRGCGPKSWGGGLRNESPELSDALRHIPIGPAVIINTPAVCDKLMYLHVSRSISIDLRINRSPCQSISIHLNRSRSIEIDRDPSPSPSMTINIDCCR